MHVILTSQHSLHFYDCLSVCVFVYLRIANHVIIQVALVEVLLTRNSSYLAKLFIYF